MQHHNITLPQTNKMNKIALNEEEREKKIFISSNRIRTQEQSEAINLKKQS